MKLPSSYILDKETIRLKAYQLICCFYANKEIARVTDPDERTNPIAKLEDKFFYREISRLLLEIAISVRVLDDQIKTLPANSEMRSKHEQAMEQINKHHSCMMFEELPLREVCNKIIHAQVVEPHVEEVNDGRHEVDVYEWLGWSEAVENGDPDVPEPTYIVWKHLTNNIRLGGKKDGKQWWLLLEVPIFVEAVSELFE